MRYLKVLQLLTIILVHLEEQKSLHIRLVPLYLLKMVLLVVVNPILQGIQQEVILILKLLQI